MIRALLVIAALACVASGPLPVHKQTDGNAWFPGEITWGAPLDCTQLDASTPLTHSGTHTYCRNCTRTNPCACGGPGAEARTEDGQWKCAEPAATCDDLCGPCVPVGSACQQTRDCCEGFCLSGVCVTSLPPCDVLLQLEQCSDMCTALDQCPCPETTSSTTSTTTSSTTTTTTCVALGDPCTTNEECCSGTCDIGVTNVCIGTTTTTTTTTSTTTTTVDFASDGTFFTQNLNFATAIRYGSGGVENSVIGGTPTISPAHGTSNRLACRFDTSPGAAYKNAHGVNCNNSTGPFCPVWTACLYQSDTPYDEANFSSTSLCCTVNSILSYCEDLVPSDNADVKEGALVTFVVSTSDAPPAFGTCSVRIGAP